MCDPVEPIYEHATSQVELRPFASAEWYHNTFGRETVETKEGSEHRITIHGTLHNPQQQYINETIIDEFEPNSVAARATCISMGDNFEDLFPGYNWASTPNMTYYHDNGHGIGTSRPPDSNGMYDEEDHDYQRERFCSMNMQRDQAENNAMGFYGLGVTQQSIETTSVQLILSRHANDIPKHAVYAVLKKFCGPVTILEETLCLDDNGNFSTRISRSRSEFHKKMKEYVPIPFDDLKHVYRTFFTAENPTGTLFLQFGMKRPMIKECIQSRFKTRFYKVDNTFQMRFNGEPIEIIPQYNPEDILFTIKDKTAVYTDGFQPIYKKALPFKGIPIPLRDVDSEAPVTVNGQNITYWMNVVRKKRDPNEKAQAFNPIIRFVCGNHVVDIDIIAAMKKSWMTSSRSPKGVFKLLHDVFTPKSYNEAHFGLMQEHTDIKSQRLLKMPMIGYDIDLHINLHPMLLGFTKTTLNTDTLEQTSFLLLSCLYESMDQFTALTYTLPSNAPFKYMFRYHSKFEKMRERAFKSYLQQRNSTYSTTYINEFFDRQRAIESTPEPAESTPEPVESESEPESESVQSTPEPVESDSEPEQLQRKRPREPTQRVKPKKKCRKNFHRDHKNLKLANQQGCCANCHCKIPLMLMQCDHVDGNSENNDPSNMQWLCLNCHGFKSGRERALRGSSTKVADDLPQHKQWSKPIVYLLHSVLDANKPLMDEMYMQEISEIALQIHQTYRQHNHVPRRSETHSPSPKDHQACS